MDRKGKPEFQFDSGLQAGIVADYLRWREITHRFQLSSI